MSLNHLSNHQVLSGLQKFVGSERNRTLIVLRYLAEVEARELQLAEGYGSMFEFCVRGYGYSEPEALLRLRAMRVMRIVPACESYVESGELSLTVLGQAYKCFRKVERQRG